MTKCVYIDFDLFIHVNDFEKLENGDCVTGYRTVTNPTEYELVPSYAFIPTATQINDNEYEVYAINK